MEKCGMCFAVKRQPKDIALQVFIRHRLAKEKFDEKFSFSFFFFLLFLFIRQPAN
jgi:hypothetical protein